MVVVFALVPLSLLAVFFAALVLVVVVVVFVFFPFVTLAFVATLDPVTIMAVLAEFDLRDLLLKPSEPSTLCELTLPMVKISTTAKVKKIIFFLIVTPHYFSFASIYSNPN